MSERRTAGSTSIVIFNAVHFKYELHFMHFDDFVAFNATNRGDSNNVIGSIKDTRCRRFEARVQNLLSPAALEYMIIGMK
jgi:hypothetical protein